MGSSFSSSRQLLGPQSRSTTGGTDDNPPYPSSWIPKVRLISDKKRQNLCWRCRRIDFDAAFGIKLPLPQQAVSSEYSVSAEQFTLRLGKLKKDQSCILCQFFYSIRCPPLEDTFDTEKEVSYLLGFKLEDNQITWAPYLYPQTYHWTSFDPSSMVLCVLTHKLLLGNSFPPSGHWIVSQVTSTGLFPDGAYKKSSAFRLTALPFCEESINFSLLRAWCERCCNHHETCASGATKTSNANLDGPVIRCIDCRTMRVVEIKSSDRYLALSYVWGAQSTRVNVADTDSAQPLPSNRMRPLPNNLPKVIEDAMAVVSRLGERYLWVDQYCIDQDNAKEKHAQIANMASIYEGAYATIVAFSASDSTCGLRGLSGLPRIAHPSVPQIKHPLSALRPSITDNRQLIASSIWMTRAWTYQEAILSRRQLIFTDYQVEFICSNAVWHECATPSMEVEDPASVGPKLDCMAITPTGKQRGNDKATVSLYDYAKYIQEYSGRCLSYQSDALNAITGLLSRISIVTYCGIPVYDALELKGLGRSSSEPAVHGEIDAYKEKSLQTFLVCLAWYPAHRSLVRRYAFPSWSWLGWEGKISFREAHLNGYPRRGSRGLAPATLLWISQQDTHNKGKAQITFPQFLQDDYLDGTTIGMLPHLSNYLWAEGPVLGLTFAVMNSIYNGSEYELFVSRTSLPHMRLLHRLSQSVNFRNYTPHPETQEAVHGRVVSEWWECLLLVVEDLGYETRGSFLILDQSLPDADTDAEGYYSVVGSAELGFYFEKQNGEMFESAAWRKILDPVRRKIKLG